MKKMMLLMIAAMFSVAAFAQEKKMTELKTSQLPKGVSEWVTKNIPGGTIARAGKIEENGTMSYAAVVDVKGQKNVFLFDKDGKFTGKGENKTKATPEAKPPVKTLESKPATKAPASEDAAPKK